MTKHVHARTASAKTNAEPVEPGAEWLRLPEVRRAFGIGRTTAYAWIAAGRIRSVCLRRPGCARGLRLINAASIRACIADAQATAPAANTVANSNSISDRL
jgi:hypothetical protein